MTKGKKGDGKYDLIVGIPSYNEADTIGFVAETASAGLEEYFPELRTAIVNVDNNSPDNTKDAFLSARTAVDKKYITTPEDVQGKGHNFLNLFRFAHETGAEAVIVMDADLKSCTKEWIEYLGRPIISGNDYVTPLYSRHQFDGSITNHICHPLIFGLLAIDIRQPIGGEFAFSRRLMEHWMKQPITATTRQYGIDIFMTMHAILGGFKLCQTGLGAKIHKPSAPKLGIMFEQVIGTFLSTLLDNRALWINGGFKGVVELERWGLKELSEPQDLKFNMVEMKEKCRSYYDQYKEFIRELLPSYAFDMIDEMISMDYFAIDIMLWSQVVYTLMHRYDISRDRETRGKILDALKPLYFARTISFNYNTWKYSVRYAEAEVRRQAMGFASQRYYLLGLYSESGMPGEFRKAVARKPSVRPAPSA
ncbi:MAG TPA: glycosyltransferase [Deltaproteobacteria bacterium]|nr:glycosyltransferase [Deltaproteobacteria bacterium]